ncbi:diguanylate cyclase domain-containing protein [Mycobacterium sp. NPDC003323]
MRGVADRWGAREYRFATGALREGRFMRVFMLVAGVSCIGLAGLLTVMQFHPQGPTGAVGRGAQILASATAVAVGVRWLRGPWPTYRQSIAFVIWADIAAGLGAVTMSTPEAQLSGSTYIGLIGIFAGFILGARILFMHCLFASAFITGVTVWAVLYEHHDGFDLFIQYIPALTWVVAVPLIGCALIDLGRRAIVRTARSAHYDSLTGLRNRRGMHSSVGRVITAGPHTTVAMAVCDIDRFKQLNDDNGHAVGDAALVALAARLRQVARPDEVTARIGGDELVLVSFVDDSDPVIELVERMSALTNVELGDSDLTVSVGIATMPASAAHFSIDDVLRHADDAMYEAKRSGGASCVVYATEPTMAATATRGHDHDRRV